MSYMRLKNLTIGYTLPASLTSIVNIDNLRVYASGENLFELDNVNVPLDPETDYTPTNTGSSFGRVYPFQRVISVGLEMQF
ncbi:TonB dependent receptor [Fodinibius roseus]|uniref:TonB dependent receptor n=1 Tax=Fodinibius roseus TaxID=1194090 RepID=A0A1M4TUA3_9BACT|nr:TonB dependent receptor [Fodinibius roseus]